jgi:UDP-galactopyranose mutase
VTIPAQQQPILCFSHLRWDFVFQRPQHILSRLAAQRRVYYVEEPVFVNGCEVASLTETVAQENVTVLRPELPPMSEENAEQAQARLLADFVSRRRIRDPILWYYTPMAIEWTHHIEYSLCVYDCMDELSMFAFAPPALVERERALLAKSAVVFTGGRSLYYRKRRFHPNVRCFPSAVDAAHFAPRPLPEPADLAGVARPRFGFYGVVDERFDRRFLDEVAQIRPNWQFVIVGPVVKIDPASLPNHPNIRYIGQRTYEQLPAYLHHWDVAILPFARNDATRFISPTKTLEYLAARKPVISTPIADVVDPYGENGLVGIAASPYEFVALGEDVVRNGLPRGWFDEVDRLVREHSWDATVAGMSAELDRAALARVLA